MSKESKPITREDVMEALKEWENPPQREYVPITPEYLRKLQEVEDDKALSEITSADKVPHPIR